MFSHSDHVKQLIKEDPAFEKRYKEACGLFRIAFHQELKKKYKKTLAELKELFHATPGTPEGVRLEYLVSKYEDILHPIESLFDEEEDDEKKR